MGLQIGNIVARRAVEFSELKGKVIAVDAFNAIYQFLTSIRQPDGTPLMDSKQRVTSHLSGLFYRNMALLNEGIKLVYVFDGEYHPLKGQTHALRQDARDAAKEKYEQAKDEEDVEGMSKYSRGFVRLTKEMIEESKELLEAMGIGVVQAPGEGEMQCAALVKQGKAWAVASQDYDAIAVGATRLIQNLTLSRKRKTPSGVVYIAPEIIEYDKVLNELGIALVKQKKYPVSIFEEVQHLLTFDWKEVFSIFKQPNVSHEEIKMPKMNLEKIKEILVQRHEFSEDRINSQLDKLKESKEKNTQQTLF
jgi:flap endonuclease-1